MLFITDQQTLDDLNIFGKYGSDSVFTIFNKTVTRGGAAILEEMFRYPLSDTLDINRRSGIVAAFALKGTGFPFDPTFFDVIDLYLSNTDDRTQLNAQEHSAAKKLTNLIAVDAETLTIHKGVIALSGLLKGLHEFVASFDKHVESHYKSEANEILLSLADPAFTVVLNRSVKSKLSAVELAEYDLLFRFRSQNVVRKLLRYIFELDVYIAVAKVALERGFAFPKALPKGEHKVHLEGLYHPQLKNPVANSIDITPESNVIFLTGANMAGKSTFMKSLSVAMYLAHMGFPVAADKMEFSVLEGMYTTINLPDDLGMGASHFYAEVLRTKKVANELRSKNLFVVFDELFRGTNVKDAAEATIAFTEAFARKIGSIFVISTHIIEAGEVLRARCKNINFTYLPTLMDGVKPVYTYKLERGITEDRHGMIIINNERIMEILDEGKGVSPASGFIADKQTLADLNLLGKYKPNSIYSLFNKVQTAGGERLLQEMFHRPLTDADQINLRCKLFRFFGALNLSFPFKKETFALAESYLNMGTPGNYPVAIAGTLIKKLQAFFFHDEQFDLVYKGLLAAIDMLSMCHDFIAKLAECDNAGGDSYRKELQLLQNLFTDPRLQWLKSQQGAQYIPLLTVAKCDFLLRYALREQMEALLESIYKLDVYISVSNVANERGFSYADALPSAENMMGSAALWHPSLIKGIANPMSFHQDQNMIFLTGANMAGKSTFMKAFGIAVYLAHMGFPVAAKDMEFSVRDGLYSSINVPDNLEQGYSHFYAEVLRVKKVAEEVAAGKNLVVLFDELFKGTNVKDAYDGTLAVTEAFSKYRNCFYIVSTHIIEVGEALQNSTLNLQFAYLPTVMDGNTPKYTYGIKQGITSDRQGMMIIENEGILELIDNERKSAESISHQEK
ncbi:DNA mismatch repair protein MutS [compost metagenome]